MLRTVCQCYIQCANVTYHNYFSLSALVLLVGCLVEHVACKKLSDEVFICLEQGADELHLVQLLPLPPHHLLLHSNPDWFNLSDAVLPILSWKRGMGVCECHNYLVLLLLGFYLSAQFSRITAR